MFGLQDLAKASIEDVNEVWAGLGYYRRAKYLLDGAKYVMNELQGVFPDTSTELQKIPGHAFRPLVLEHSDHKWKLYSLMAYHLSISNLTEGAPPIACFLPAHFLPTRNLAMVEATPSNDH